jgi:hypothetical protein
MQPQRSQRAPPTTNGGYLEAFKQEKGKRDSAEAKENEKPGPTSWLMMRKQMDKGKSVENLKKAPPVQLNDEDRPIVNNRHKKAQALNDSDASIPLKSSRHNESR